MRRWLAVVAVVLGGAHLAAPAEACEGTTADPAIAAQAQAIGGALPLAYVGTFQWDGAPQGDPVAFTFTDCRIDGVILLNGTGQYLASGTTIDLLGRLAGGKIVLFEANPRDGRGGFVTDGRHHGSIAPDLSRICATWVTDVSGERGLLRLGFTAADAAACDGSAPIS
ncbi:MAG: hypothetical protein R3F55_18700 [Alphaproteobacteria bacterium]